MMGENVEDAGVSQQEQIIARLHGQTRNRIHQMVDVNDIFLCLDVAALIQSMRVSKRSDSCVTMGYE